MKSRQLALREATKGGNHGPPVIHAADAQQNTAASKGTAKPITSDKVSHDAVKSATKDAKP